MPGSDDNFKLDIAVAQEAFDRLNTELFGGQLRRIPFRLSNAVRIGGKYIAKMFYEQPNARLRRLLRDRRIKDLHDQAIILSRKAILTQGTLDIVMAHEMIHQWQASVLGISEDNGGHGDTFHSKMDEINAVKGAGFVTVTSDVVAGGTGGKAGQTYYVAIFENGGRFGGFSRRPFTENILAILEQTSKRRGAYSTIVTTSHDAQTLTNMSRMRLNSRSRSWTHIPDDIYDAIVSGEVITAALRRAAMRVADLQGVTLYHGTSIETAAKIAREGIRSFSGDQWSGNPLIANAGTDAIYMTPDFELALRYAQGLGAGRTPAVLETRVSGRHMRKLKTDQMDTWENAWDDDGDGDPELPQHQDSLYRLQNDIHSFLSERGVDVPFFEAFPGDDEFDEYDGLNIYRLILKYIRQSSPERANEVFQEFRKAFPPGDHGFYHIRPDGTVRLDSSYWEEAHQLQYSPRGGQNAKLPPAAIKAVWIPAGMAPDGAESRRVSPKKLPGESRKEFDDEARASESVGEWCDALSAPDWMQEIGRIRVDDIRLDDIDDDSPKPLLEVRQVARSMMKSPGRNHSRRIQKLREKHKGFFDDPRERWGDDAYGESIEMAKVSLDSLKLKGVAAALRAATLDIAASSGMVVVYHATLSGSDILEGGFKKSDEVERVGLGGSSIGGSVSFTTDWDVARGIHKSFAMMHSLVNADDPLTAMREHFTSLDDRLATSVLEYWKSADGTDLKGLLDGWKPKPYGARMQTYDQLVQQGFKPVDAVGGEGLGGKGDTSYYQWLEPVTDVDVERMVYTYVKVYFYANDEEYNPVFMGGDASHFKGIPRDDIGVLTVELHVDPSKKHKSHGELHRSPGYAILPAESEYRVSDMSMIGKVLDYDTHPGDEPKVRADEVSFHSDSETEETVNRLLSLLQRHRGIIERGGEVDVRQAMALLRNADDMWDVRGLAEKILAATKLKHAKGFLEQVIDLRQRSQPSDNGSKAIAALPPSVRSEVESAAYSVRFSDISERWYDRDESAYIVWVDRLDDIGMSESTAESEIDDWISSKQWGYEERIAEQLKWVKTDVPGFREEDADEFLELASGLEMATQQAKAASTLRVAIRTVFEVGDSSKGRHFILRQGRLWLWSDDMSEAEERELAESIRDEFGTDRPPFDQKFPIDSKWRVRDMFEPSGLFGPSTDEDMTKFREFASDTLFGMVLQDGRLRARTVAGLPVHADHPEMEKLLKHLGAEVERPQPKDMWYHGFIAMPERMASVARFGLRPGDVVGESNWERNEEYDRSLVYLTTDEMNAKGHATGSEGKYPYAVVVSVREDDLDRTRIEADFDAARAGLGPNRAGLAGYRGRIPVSVFSEVRIYKNGYNQETTPLLLTLGSDEFSALAKEYAEWAERTLEDREALEKEQMHPSFTDHRRVQELRDRIDRDPIRLAVDAGKELGIAASLRTARMEVLHG